MIGFRRGKVQYYRHISLLVCVVMVLGLFVSFSPQPAGAATYPYTSTDLAKYLQSLYDKVPSSEMSTLNTISANANSSTYLQVYDNGPSVAPWPTVFANLSVTALAGNKYGGDQNQAKNAVSRLLIDFAQLVYYGGSLPNGTSYTSYLSEINNLWSNDQSTIQKILDPSTPITEDEFSSYMLDSIKDIPNEYNQLLGSYPSTVSGLNLTDPETNLFVQVCIAKALDDTALKSTYSQFGANSGGAGWSFGDLIENGYRYVDGVIGLLTIDGQLKESCGEVILVYYMLPTSSGGGGGGGGNTPQLNPPAVPPPVPPPAASPSVFIARWPGHVDLDQTFLIPIPAAGPVPTSFVVSAPDQGKLAAAKAQGLEQRVYYFNEQYQKWVALASYPQADGSVLVENDGGYNNSWTEMFAVREPHYTDITGNWSEDVVNRMNGLALIEGYPIPDDPNTQDRLAGVDRNISRAEFATILARALGCLPPDEQKLYGVLLPQGEEPDQVLAGWSGVPDWSRDFVAGMVYSGLIQGEAPGYFAGNNPITRIEAAVLVSKVLNKLPNYKPADLSQFKDAADVPDWARAAVVDGVLNGYPNGTLLPNNPITRAESLVTILKLLRALGW
jgi:hypothetical protein